MSVWTLDVNGDLPNHTTRVELDGVNYELELRWNARAGAWFLIILDDEGEVLLGSRRIHPGSPVLGNLRGQRGLPPGELLPIDTTQSDSPPGLGELGDRVQLTYVDEADLP